MLYYTRVQDTLTITNNIICVDLARPWLAYEEAKGSAGNRLLPVGGWSLW